MVQMNIQKAYDIINLKAMEKVLTEIGFPMKFIEWVMLIVTTVSCRFNINGRYTHIMEV